MIILAVVSINAVLGENGIIRQAERARDFQANAEAADNEALDTLDQHLANAMAGEGNGGEDGEGTGDGDVTTTVDGVTIPVGFYYVGGTKDSGLVISDDSADENKYKDQEIVGTELEGNQFVWIPVENYDNFHLIEGYYNGSLDTKLSKASNPSREAGATEAAGTPLANNSTAGTSESIAMYKSVKDNKGFYIARYEAGISGTTANSKLETKIVADGNTKPLSKYGVGVWNRISWGGTSSNTASDGLPGDDTANGAVKVARSMYTKSSTCGVTSTLCYGVQWDAIMNFIDSNYLTGTCANDSFVKNSDKQGNYSETLSTTGYYAVKNDSINLSV